MLFLIYYSRFLLLCHPLSFAGGVFFLALKSLLLICPQEHFNYYTMDAALGHLVFSMKYDVIGDQEHLRLMLRYSFLLLLSLTCFLFHLCLFIFPFFFLLNHNTLPLSTMPSLPLSHLYFSFYDILFIYVSLSPFLTLNLH